MSNYKIRINAVEKLRVLKTIYTYQQLEEILRIQTPVLARYLALKNLPTIERAQQIINVFNKINLGDIVKGNIKVRNEIIDITQLLANVSLLKILASTIDFDATIVLTMATDGIPFATILAGKLNAKLAYVKDKEEPGVFDFYQVDVRFGPGIYRKRFYLPKNLLSKNDKVLIVDDILRTGKTFEILLEFVKLAKAEVIGGVTLIAKRDAVTKIKKKVNRFRTFCLL